jgi:hypothetical protein
VLSWRLEGGVPYGSGAGLGNEGVALGTMRKVDAGATTRSCFSFPGTPSDVWAKRRSGALGVVNPVVAEGRDRIMQMQMGDAYLDP